LLGGFFFALLLFLVDMSHSHDPSISALPAGDPESVRLNGNVVVARSRAPSLVDEQGRKLVVFTEEEWASELENTRKATRLMSDEQYVEDVTVEFLYRKHTVLALAVVTGVLIYLTFTQAPHATLFENTKMGVWASIFFLLTLGMLVFPNGPFIRPHPLLWRLTFGVGVVYNIFLTILLFQNKADARALMTIFDADLGVRPVDKDYATHCEITFNTVYNAVNDRFFVAHFVGWVLKSLMLRDPVLCWVVSVQWEIIEIAFTHMLPNFAECWWDQWVMDVLLTNGLGIYVGHKLCVWLEVKRYKWSGFRSIPTAFGRLQRALLQLTPESWTKVEWNATKNIKRFLMLHALILCVHMNELNAFFLKHLLWIPSESSLNMYRLTIWFFVALPTMRQFYVFMTDARCKRIGHHAFLACVIIATEFLIILKFSPDEFPIPMPDYPKKVVTIFVSLYLVVFGVIFYRIRRRDWLLVQKQHQS